MAAIKWCFCTLLLALSFLHLATTTPLLSHQVDGYGPQPLERRQSSSFVPITGITTFDVQPRLEIRELQQNADQWNIYLLGLARFQATDQSDKRSYYQIAGIHGRPFAPWDGVSPPVGINSPGYCTHDSNLFLPWHRPYLALYEQVLYQHIVDAVNSFPAGHIRQRYAGAALSWRHPYWDWAATPSDGGSVYPSILTAPTVSVTMANGTNTIANPLYSYKFHPVSATDFYYNPFASWNETKRYPTSWDADATSQDSLVGPLLDNNRVSIADRLYNLFTNYNNFTEFGNEAWFSQSVSNADSLEAIHDAIHSLVGTNGHMTYLDYSAFDPIFWLHHAMIDRCFALWQALYTNSYVEPMAAIEQTFAIAIGTVVTAESPLYPFHRNANGSFWTSTSSRSVKYFGYTYTDLASGNVSAVKANINRLYADSAGTSSISKRNAADLSTGSKDFMVASNHSLIPAPEEITAGGQYREYLANIRSPRMELNQSYAIYVFMGDFDDTPSAWPLSSNLVGTHAVFAALTNAAVARTSLQAKNRMPATPIQVTGTMPLTSKLLGKVQAGELPCMDVETVSAYLADNLHWRVGTFDNSQVPIEVFSDFQITVVSAEAEPAASKDQFPKWGDFTELHNVTSGKVGGCP